MRKIYWQVKLSRGRWVRRHLLATMSDLFYDPSMALDKATTFGGGLYCTEVLAATGPVRT